MEAAVEVLGTVVIGARTYKVSSQPVMWDMQEKAGIQHYFRMEGANGALYLVIDYGPRYELTSLNCGRSRAPRPLQGLTRELMTPFGVEVSR